MISENDKQAILNGAFGVTREGKKVKYIGRYASKDKTSFPCLFVVFNQNDEITRTLYLSENLTNFKDLGSVNDVVGLWENRVDLFNLERALAGEPVMLRNGLKANILKQIKDTLIGYFDECSPFSWDINGDASLAAESNHDIICMWKEPEPELNTVTFTLPSALKEPKDEMWVLTPEGYVRSMYNKYIPLDRFNKRIFFNSEEDAKAWFDAMQDSRK